MKRRAALMLGGVTLLEFSCRQPRKSAPKLLESARSRPAPLAASRIGGTPTRGQSYFAELLVFSSGRVDAALSDPEGHALDEPADVSVELSTRSGKSVTVPLRYSPRRARFQGQVPHGTEMVSGAATLRIAHNERNDVISVPRALVLVGPERGGHMFSLGALGVELVPEVSGVVHAVVRDADGAPVRDPKLSLEATLLAQSLEKDRVALVWDASSASYAGKAAVPLRPGPMELAISSARARIQQAGLLPVPRHGGRALLVGFHAVEILLRPDEVELFVYDAFGKPYPAGHLELVVAFEAPQALLYRLSWDEKTFSYRATLRGRNVAGLAVSVSLTAGEHTDFGAVASL